MNPFLGHTEAERKCLLETIGEESVESLFDHQIPAELRFHGDLPIPPALAEGELFRVARERAAKNLPGVGPRSFLGAGIYDHTIPHIVNHLVSRGEFLTSYTPYQPEASQGMLQAIFEYQTMVCELTGMDIANASLYDGSTALAEAALMALGAARKRTKVLVAPGAHPQYREVLGAYLKNLPYEMALAPAAEGRVDAAALRGALDETVAAVAVAHPNFYGLLEDMPALSEAAHAAGAYLIVVFDPIALGVLAPPGAYGADVAVGEGQALGMPAYYGGDTLGMFACAKEFMRKLPGRLVGEARDRNGKKGYVLALQTREQHIRREKATSNICTNQGLNALKAAIAMAAWGPHGLRDLAEASCRMTRLLVERLGALAGARPAFPGPYFKECAVRFGADGDALHARLLEQGFLAGLPLGAFDSSLRDCLLLCATETKTAEDIERFAEAAARAVKA
ncbi:MAG: aminomethyl-transferring glycine dehydrogenase subunit GcvPA [Candidatus Sumerlaeota bacterium]|nr:aminomethyl-transferring glycine dehydrogenase subunit GcvPA [Candidatus Sumerlaeota bacterium]